MLPKVGYSIISMIEMIHLNFVRIRPETPIVLKSVLGLSSVI